MLRLAQRLATAVFPALVLSGAGWLPVVASGQDAAVLDNMIFDPVLLEAGEPVMAAVPDPASTARLQAVVPEQADIAFPFPPDAPSSERMAAIAAYETEISDLERRNGQFAPALTEKLLSLGRLMQEQGAHTEAIAVLERADHVSRINNGLHHPEQVPIVESQVDSLLALGDFAAVNDKQHYLHYLTQKLEANGRIAPVPALAGLGDQNMQAFGLSLVEQVAPSAPGSLRFGGMDTPSAPEIARIHAINSLYRAKSHYSDAISTIIDNGNYLNPRLLELEYKFLETLFLSGYGQELINNPHYYLTSARRTANQASRWTYLRRNSDGYEAGIETFERILAYLENDPETPAMERVRAHLEYGDWHLVFGWDEAAVVEYGRAWTLAQALGIDTDNMGALFSPDLPMQLPLFTPKPNSREKFGLDPGLPLDYDGHVDASFLINKNGTARNIKITGKSDNASHAVIGRLRRYLKNSPFRPRIEDGEPVTWEPVTMRYYYSFQ